MKNIDNIKSQVVDDRLDEAQKELNKLIQLTGPKLKLYIIKVDLQDMLGLFEEALQTCDFCLFFDPVNQRCHEKKLQLLKKLKMFKKISEYYPYTNKLFPDTGI